MNFCISHGGGGGLGVVQLRDEHYAGLESRSFLSLAQARSKALKIDFTADPPAPRPSFLGTQEFLEFPLEDLLCGIDWTPFFETWQLRGRYPNRGYPKIFNDATVGEEAQVSSPYPSPRSAVELSVFMWAHIRENPTGNTYFLMFGVCAETLCRCSETSQGDRGRQVTGSPRNCLC